GGEGPVVAQQCPQDADSSAGEGDDGLDVLEAFGSLFEIEVAVGSVADDAGLRGEVEHPAQCPVVALGPVQVAGAPAGVARDRHQPGRGGQVPVVGVGGEVAGG